MAFEYEILLGSLVMRSWKRCEDEVVWRRKQEMELWLGAEEGGEEC